MLMFEPLTEEETEQLEALDESRAERLARIEALSWLSRHTYARGYSKLIASGK